jgi:hypothetical protein
MADKKLLPCPVCGAEVVVKDYQRLGYWITHRDSNKCGVVFDMSRYGDKFTGGAKERRAVIEAWNCRPDIKVGKIDTAHNTRKPKR